MTLPATVHNIGLGGLHGANYLPKYVVQRGHDLTGSGMMRVNHLFYFALMAKITINGRKNRLDKGTFMLIAKFIPFIGCMTVITANLTILCCCMG